MQLRNARRPDLTPLYRRLAKALAQKGAPLILSALPRGQGIRYCYRCGSKALGHGMPVCCPAQVPRCWMTVAVLWEISFTPM